MAQSASKLALGTGKMAPKALVPGSGREWVTSRIFQEEGQRPKLFSVCLHLLSN